MSVNKLIQFINKQLNQGVILWLFTAMEYTPIDFENTEVAYALKTKKGLKLAKTLFSVSQSPGLSNMGRHLLKFGISARLPVNGTVKATLYKHFIRGESNEKTIPLMKKLAKYNVGSILDYSLEGIDSEAEYDKAVEEFLSNVEVASQNEEIPYSVSKPSAIAHHNIMEKVSAKAELNQNETAEFDRVRARFHSIFKKAQELEVRVMVDAEESWIQPAIDMLTNEMMDHYNKERVIALNTFQLYRKDRYDYLVSSFKRCKANGIKMRAKLVRGAYMEKERERAAEMGYESPINETKAATNKMYNDGMLYCLEHIDQGEVFYWHAQ